MTMMAKVFYLMLRSGPYYIIRRAHQHGALVHSVAIAGHLRFRGSITTFGASYIRDLLQSGKAEIGATPDFEFPE